MQKKMSLSILIGIVSLTVFSQTLEEGKKLLYYEKNKSALEVFKNIVAAKSSDPLSIYWLGQAYLANNDLSSAKNLYAQQKVANDPWILVGLGHIDLLEKKDEAAKEKFEKALEISKSKKGVYNTDILLAVGMANADGDSKTGDAKYAIEKLTLAAELDKQNPEPMFLLGICYLKAGREYGGESVKAFREATNRNPNYAKAYYRIGRIFQVQRNYESMSEEFDKAIKADPTFGLTYLAYFFYYQYKDVNLGKQNLDKYIANSDKDCNSDYYVADYLYRAGKYNESLEKIKTMEANDCKNFMLLHILYAYNYEKLGDTLNTKIHLTKYLGETEADKITLTDYDFAAKFYAKFAADKPMAIVYFLQAADLATSKNEKIEFFSNAARVAADAGLFEKQIELLNKITDLKGVKEENDYYLLTKAAIDAKNWVSADSLSNLYITAFPEKPQGYAFNVIVAKLLDADTTKGLAIKPITLYNDFLLKDKEKNKKTLYANYYYLLIYYAQKAGDIQSAIDVTNKMMELYKEGEEYNFAKTINEQLLKKMGKKQK
ncbi:MAG TPA: hypothetical protein VFN30_11350 [Chitinophagaceae bacterium]|nr:hypothetical protein [Chitinophagaceae bacterium]